MMLRYMDLHQHAAKIESACFAVGIFFTLHIVLSVQAVRGEHRYFEYSGAILKLLLNAFKGIVA
jgi:hypothetical protein